MKAGYILGLVAVVIAAVFHDHWYGEVGSILMGVLGIIVWTDGRERADRERLRRLDRRQVERRTV